MGREWVIAGLREKKRHRSRDTCWLVRLPSFQQSTEDIDYEPALCSTVSYANPVPFLGNWSRT